MFMSFFGNLKDLFGLNKSKKDERTKLNTLANQIQDFINIYITQFMVQGQADNLICNLRGYWQVLWSSAR